MTTITKEALEWIQDEMDFLRSQFDTVEEELQEALDGNAAKDAIIAEKDETIASLVAQLARMMATLQTE